MQKPNENILLRIWRAWIRFGHLIGEVMSWVWMPLFYYIIAMPIALWVKASKDPLQVNTGKKGSYWTEKDLPEQNLDWAKSQGSTVLPSSTSSK